LAGLDYLELLSAYDVSQMSSVWRKMIRRSFLDENGIFSPEVNFGEDVPYSFKALITAKRFMSIPDVCYQYRSNPEALTGSGWQPTARTLYEKCFHNARLIYDVYKMVPAGYPNVAKSFKTAAAYTRGQFTSFYGKMTPTEQKLFRSRCRKSIIKNSFAFHLLSRKRALLYLAWLSGVSSRLIIQHD
jgi:hypothetical protein